MSNVDALATGQTEPTFWRADALAFVEARSIADGRKVHYGKHAHETFSIGIVTSGRCRYLSGRTQQSIGAGTVVLMNPGDTHACNPERDGGPWSYRMLYFDVPWMIGVQQAFGRDQTDQFRAFEAIASRESTLYAGLHRLYDVLTDSQADVLEKHSEATSFMTRVHRILSPLPEVPSQGHRGLERAAEFIRNNCARAVRLEEICTAAELSPSYLIRAFNLKYGLTPHAYLINCRIEFSRSELRRGRPIAEVALAAGFADQAHLQRSFKRLVAATPGQYRAGREAQG